MQTEIHRKEAGARTEGFSRDFARQVYDGQPLFHHRDFEEFFLNTIITIQDTPRWEYVVKDDDGNIVASMAVYSDYDMHVGVCLSVLVAFSTEPSALFGGYKWLFSLAKEYEYPFVAYTKAISQYEMVLKYKRINHGNS